MEVDNRPEHLIAIDFLRAKGHYVGDFKLSDNQCFVDVLSVSDLGIIAIAQCYGHEWMEHLCRLRGQQPPPRHRLSERERHSDLWQAAMFHLLWPGPHPQNS